MEHLAEEGNLGAALLLTYLSEVIILLLDGALTPLHPLKSSYRHP